MLEIAVFILLETNYKTVLKNYFQMSSYFVKLFNADRVSEAHCLTCMNL